MKFQQIHNGTMILDYHGKKFLLNLNVNEDIPADLQGEKWDGCIMTSVDLAPISEKENIKLPRDVDVYVLNEDDANRMTAMGFTEVNVVPEGGLNVGGVDLTLAHCNLTKEKKVHYGLFMKAEDEKSVYAASDHVTYDELEHDLGHYKPDIVIVDGETQSLDKNDLDCEVGRVVHDLENILKIAKEEPHYVILVSHLTRLNPLHLNREDVQSWIKRVQKKHWIVIPETDKVYEY